MAQSQEITDEGIQEWVVLMSDASSPAATAMNKIVCMNDTTACTASKQSSSTGPVDAWHTTGYGLSIDTIDTMSQTTSNSTGGHNDTITFDHVFTLSSTAAKSVSGIQACNDDGDVTFVECCFASIISMENTDTLTIDGAVVVDQA